MENRRGSGIFLGVVGVATLVVAIIGATFAYFSASVVGETPVEVESYEFDADIIVEEVTKTKTDAAKRLIPLETSKLSDALTAECVDKNGYQACALYKVTITNNGDADITLTGSIRTLLNSNDAKDSHFTDLVYQPLTQTETSYTVNGAAINLGGTLVTLESAIDTKPTVSIPTVTLKKAGSTITGEDETVVRTDQTVFYAVVYLEDKLVGEEGQETTTDQSAQMGVSYQGQFVYVSGDGNGKITATFGV